MAGCNHVKTLSEVQDLRAWRAFLVEAHGVCYPLESLRFVLGMTLDDALSAFGLGGSVWARERWGELRAALDAPVDAPVASTAERGDVPEAA